MNNITTMPDGPKADERADRAKAEAKFADRLFKILLEVQDDDPPNFRDIRRPGELNEKWSKIYNQIWDAAFATVSAKRKKKEEKQHA